MSFWSYLFVVTALFGFIPEVFAVSYSGVGGQTEAYGAVTGTFMLGQMASKICRKYPSLKRKADEAGKGYLATNQPMFDKVSYRMADLARKNGGEVEYRRLKTESDAAISEMQDSVPLELEKIAANVQGCSEILASLKHGDWDIQAMRSREIEAILGPQDLLHSPAFLQGVMNGCIDGQKRKFHQQGISYEKNKEQVRQYCHCMTPLTAEMVSTADGRAKVMDGESKIKARVQKMDAICLDGVANGRRFAP